MKILPPRHALRFLRWFCREDCVEEIEGDITEVFEKQFEQSPGKAKRKFIWSVIKYFRPEFIKAFSISYHINPLHMVRHNLLITYRNFLRYKSSFFINLVGLSTGLASVFLIYLWVYDELAMDKFHEKGSRLFQVLQNSGGPTNNIETHGSNSVLLPRALELEMPEVEHVVPMRPAGAGIVWVGKRGVKATGMFAGKDFFNVFTYGIVKGNKDLLLKEKYAMVIADDLAIKLFGSPENSLGKTVVWDHDQYGGTHIVSGVFKKPKQNSSENFDFLVTHEAFLEKNRMDESWESNPILTYLTLKEGTDLGGFNTKLNNFYQSKRKGDPEWSGGMFLQRYADRYLYGHFENGQQAGGRIDYVELFSTIALFILLIACINFMNLSTSRASRRTKEVGVKKAIGAERRTIVLQHLGESFLMVLLAFVIALLIVFLFLPQFNLITGKQLTFMQDWKPFLGALFIGLITGAISGSYPAFYLSRFRVADVLKGKLNTSLSEFFVRKGLVVFQFTISILLIVSVVIVYKQMDFIQSKNLGYDKENVILFQREGRLNNDLDSFLAAARATAGVENISSIGASITNNGSGSSGHTWEGQPLGPELEFTGATVNYDLIETLGIKLKEGRSFSREFSDVEAKVVLNETAVKRMGLSNPIGKWMEMWGTKREIIGVVKDFHFQSMYEDIRPIFLMCSPENTHSIVVRIQAGTERQTLAKLESLYNKFNPGISFEFKFLDDEYQELYVAEQRVASLSKYFAVIAILISCLGLFGLAAFSAERRTKEIGIRKILGSTEVAIVRLLSRDFTRMVLMAIGIALPISYFMIRYWLQSFAYRIELEWWFFAGAGLTAMLITWITVGAQTIRAARINPSECLRNE